MAPQQCGVVALHKAATPNCAELLSASPPVATAPNAPRSLRTLDSRLATSLPGGPRLDCTRTGPASVTPECVLQRMLETLTGALARATSGDWLLLVGGLLLAFYIVGTWNYDYFERRGIPSTKPRLPLGGDFLAVFTGFRSFHDGMQGLYDMGKGHGVFGAYEITKPILLIRDPELLKVVGVKEFDHFTNHRSFASEKTDPIFGKNLFNLKDQAWRDMRATLSPAFTTSKIKAMLPLMSQCADQFSEYLRDKYASSKEGSMKKPLVFDLKDLFTRLTNDIIATTAFGVSCDSLKNPNNEFYTRGKIRTTFSKLRTLALFAFFAVPKLMEKTGLRMLDAESTNFFDSLVHDTIRERQRRGIVRPDVLQLLMQARQGKLQAEKEDAAEAEALGGGRSVSGANKLSDDDISAQALIFFFAGFETVATALCLTSTVLSHHEDVQRRLRAEVDGVMEATRGRPTYDAIQGMKYLDAVLSEVLRLYPPVPSTDRVCAKDITLPAGEHSNAVTVAKGTVINAPILGLHTDPQYWEEPLKFDPERFSDENKHKIKPYTYMPFGMGPRICIGQRFALIEVKMALVHLLHSFELHPCARTKYPIKFKTGANLMAKDGFWCGFTPRDA